uniref:Uncharacterized protein n=1 Tax=Ornithodoros turicata TaxID=34597 RepID=A0A2R5LKN9_9ACAR
MYAPTESELKEKLENLRSPSRSPPSAISPRKRNVRLGYHTWTPGMLHEQLRREGSRCECCPYGYHIHRDFVAYCDSLGTTDSQLDRLRKMRGQRRRQRKSLENYLGMLKMDEQKQAVLRVPVKKTAMSAPPPDLLSSSALQDVFKDFEDALSSHEKGFSNNTRADLEKVDLLRSAYSDAPVTFSDTEHPAVVSELHHDILDAVFSPSRPRSDSFSSISSQSTTASYAVPDLSQNWRFASRQLAESVAALNAPNTGGEPNWAALTRVRQMMASSLKQLRLLEEQVKTIPLLQVKMSILKEEKRLLMLQLRAKTVGPVGDISPGDDVSARLRKLDDNGIATPRLQCLTESETDVAASLSALAASLDAAFRKTPQQALIPEGTFVDSVTDVRKPACTQRTIGVECSVPTRSIGIGDGQVLMDVVHTKETELKEAIEAITSERNLKRHESRETNTDSDLDAEKKKKRKECLKVMRVEHTSVKPNRQPCVDCATQAVKRTITADAATATERVSFADASVVVDVTTPAVSKLGTLHQSSQTHRILKTNICIQVAPAAIKKRDTCVQLDPIDRRHVGLQVDMQAKKPTSAARKHSVCVGNHVKMRDCATSASILKQTQASGECSILDTFCDRCELKQTETIGVGDADVSVTYCEGCLQKQEWPTDEQQVMSRSFGVNLCDKCSSQIENVAKDFIDKNVLDPALPTLMSRIPKLASRAARSRPTSAPLGCENRRVLLGSLDVPERSEPRDRSQKHELSKEVKAACKVLNDYLMKPERGDPNKLKTAVTLIQQEWFRVASPANADPNVVEDYMDGFEEYSRHLLHRIVNMADVNGNTAIHYAVSHGNFDVVSILLDSKVCDVSKQNKAGYTCMMLVSLTEIKNDTHRHVVQRLFQLGDVNTKATQNGQTALMLAASHGRLETVKLLLEGGAEPNVQDNEGSTALMCAAEHGHIEIVRALLAHPDTELSLVDSDGSTALQIAMEAGHKDTALLIYASSNFSRGSSPYSSLRIRKSVTPRSTPPPSRTPRTPPPPSPARSRRSSSSH